MFVSVFSDVSLIKGILYGRNYVCDLEIRDRAGTSSCPYIQLYIESVSGVEYSLNLKNKLMFLQILLQDRPK